jgi:hypothetical protein
MTVVDPSSSSSGGTLFSNLDISTLIEQANDYTQRATDSFETSFKEFQSTLDDVMGFSDPYVMSPKGCIDSSSIGTNTNDTKDEISSNVRRGRPTTPVARMKSSKEGVESKQQQQRDLHQKIGNGNDTNNDKGPTEMGSRRQEVQQQKQKQQEATSYQNGWGDDFDFTDNPCGPIRDSLYLSDSHKKNNNHHNSNSSKDTVSEDAKSVTFSTLSSILGPSSTKVTVGPAALKGAIHPSSKSKSSTTKHDVVSHTSKMMTPIKLQRQQQTTTGSNTRVVEPSPSRPFDESPAPPLSKQKAPAMTMTMTTPTTRIISKIDTTLTDEDEHTDTDDVGHEVQDSKYTDDDEDDNGTDEDDDGTDHEDNDAGHNNHNSNNNNKMHSSFLSDAESIVKNLFFSSFSPTKVDTAAVGTPNQQKISMKSIDTKKDTADNSTQKNATKGTKNKNHHHHRRYSTKTKLITRRKTHIKQSVGVDVVLRLSSDESVTSPQQNQKHQKENKQSSSIFLLVVSKIHSDSIFTETDLKVGDAICSINGVLFWDGTTTTRAATNEKDGYRGWGANSLNNTPPASILEKALSVLGDEKARKVTIAYRRLLGDDEEDDSEGDHDGGQHTMSSRREGVVESPRHRLEGTYSESHSPIKSNWDKKEGTFHFEEKKCDIGDVDDAVAERVATTSSTSRHRTLVDGRGDVRNVVSTPSPGKSLDQPPTPHRGLWARALRLDRNRDKKFDDVTPRKSNLNVGSTPTSRRITSIGSALGRGRGRQRTSSQRKGQSASPVRSSPQKETAKTNRDGVETTNESVTPMSSTQKKKKVTPEWGSFLKSSPSQSSHSRTSHSRKSQPSPSRSTEPTISQRTEKTSSPTPSNSRLEELRAKNHMLRATGHERIEESRKKLRSSEVGYAASSSTSVTSSLPSVHVSSTGWGSTIRKVDTTKGEEYDSCHSPEDLATQLRYDVARTQKSGGNEKERSDEKVKVPRQHLLLPTYETTGQLARSVEDPAGSSPSNDLVDNYRDNGDNTLTNHQGYVDIVTGVVPEDSTGTSPRVLSCWQEGSEHAGHQSLISEVTEEMRDPPAKWVEVAPDSFTQINEHRNLALLDDNSVSSMEYVGFSTTVIATARETDVTKQKQEELTYVNTKVVEMLRARIEQLKRNNMLLAEETKALRDEDFQKGSILTTMQSRLREAHERERSLNAELELSKSRFSISTIQADKRQQEFFAEIDKLKLVSDNRADVLKERIGALERTNRRLVTKLEDVERERDSMKKMQIEIEGLRKEVSDQAAALDATVASKNRLQDRNNDLQQELDEKKRGPCENSEQSHATEVAVCTARISFLEKQVETLKSELGTRDSMASGLSEQRPALQHDAGDAWRQLEDLEKQLNLRVQMESEAGSFESENNDLTGSTSDDSYDSDSSSVLVERILEIENALKTCEISMESREILQRRLLKTAQKLATLNISADVA